MTKPPEDLLQEASPDFFPLQVGPLWILFLEKGVHVISTHMNSIAAFKKEKFIFNKQPNKY